MKKIKTIKKILVISYKFSPDVGGIETIGKILCRELVSLGFQVTVLTASGGTGVKEYISEVLILRKPDLRDLLEAVIEADLVFHNNISLSLGWLSFLLFKPQVIRHATWINHSSILMMPAIAKLNLLRMAHNIANSSAVAQHLSVPSVVIGNPFDADQFRQLHNISRDRDLVFVGRLVSDKGVDLLLEALVELQTQALYPTTTIVGGGPEEESLKLLTRDLGLEDQVIFTGLLQGEDLVTTLNAHRILVVPSRWREPFGIVALEGIACGCVVVGSEGGGLKDAIGPCGLTFPNGDVEGLAQCLERLLRDPATLENYREAAHRHLQAHHPRSVVQRYLQVMESAYRHQPLPVIGSE